MRLKSYGFLNTYVKRDLVQKSLIFFLEKKHAFLKNWEKVANLLKNAYKRLFFP